MKKINFSFKRLWALIIKEFTQFRRDRATFALVIMIPIIDMLLFGLAINTNPKNLPASIINYDQGPFSRTLINEIHQTNYFNFNHAANSEVEADELMLKHQTLFTLNIPSDFSRNVVRGKNPSALLEVDGTDPVSVAFALSAVNGLMPTIFQYDLHGPLENLVQTNAAATLLTQVKYNPSLITQYNIVPGLMGIVLTLTFVMVASMALTRERERGTMEILLSTPISPFEVIIGKALPFLVVGYCQVLVILVLAVFFFGVPFRGNLFLLLLVTFPFMLSNLFIGIMISTFSNTQLEASQMGILFFLPSLLLSGFAFPYFGMPLWAQWIGYMLPMYHYVYMIRGIMLKNIGFAEAWVDIWPLLIFLMIILVIALKRYRRTLD